MRCSFILLLYFHVSALFLSLFHPLLLPFLSLFHFHFILSPSSLLILFFAPTFFLSYYSRSSFSRISRTDSLTTISLNSPPLSCLLDGSVYFERVVITPATIASLHCLLWSGGTACNLYERRRRDIQTARKRLRVARIESDKERRG